MRLCSYCRYNESTPKNMLEVTSKLNSMTLYAVCFCGSVVGDNGRITL